MNIVELYYDNIFIDDVENFLERNNFSYFKPHEKKSVIQSLKDSVFDSYYGVYHNGFMIAYGMLRGMDEGYKIPMLGIGVDKSYQKKGVGTLLMKFLEVECILNNYSKIRLKVYRDNLNAIEFYLHLNYQGFDNKEENIIMEKVLYNEGN